MILHRLTIRKRILIIFLMVAITGGVVQFIVAGRYLQLATLEFYQHHLETDALLVSTAFAEPLVEYLDGEDSSSISQVMGTLQQEVGHNYLIVDRNNRVMGYTANTGYEQVDRVPDTPELIQARSEHIGADIRPNNQGEATLYVAITVSYENNPLGTFVLSEPMQPAYDEVTRRYLELAGATVPVLALVIAASLWIAGTISRPIQSLRNSAMRMAHGALDTRIQVHSQDEIGELANTFNYMAGQIETLMHTQRSFVSNAAHELRTPLMTLKLRAEALSEEALPADEQETYLREIRQEVDHMAELVSSLLMLARIDEGRHQPNGTVTDTVATLHDIMRHWRIEAETKGLRFTAQIDPDLPDLPMSPNDLRVVLDNLLSNAIKYTTRGEVRLSVSHRKDAFTLEVSDTGVGFLPEQGTHLFDRFYRSEQVRGQYAGNGLGLSIVQSILNHYGGRIEAHSAGIGQGAVFTLRLTPAP